MYQFVFFYFSMFISNLALKSMDPASQHPVLVGPSWHPGAG
jgi:hypothetical protein